MTEEPYYKTMLKLAVGLIDTNLHDSLILDAAVTCMIYNKLDREGFSI